MIRPPTVFDLILSDFCVEKCFFNFRLLRTWEPKGLDFKNKGKSLLFLKRVIISSPQIPPRGTAIISALIFYQNVIVFFKQNSPNFKITPSPTSLKDFCFIDFALYCLFCILLKTQRVTLYFVFRFDWNVLMRMFEFGYDYI